MKIKLMEGCELTGYDIVAKIVLQMIKSHLSTTPDCSIIVRIGELNEREGTKYITYNNELLTPIGWHNIHDMSEWEWENDWWEGQREFYFDGFTLLKDVTMDYVPSYDPYFSKDPYLAKIHYKGNTWIKDVGDMSWLPNYFPLVEITEDK